MATQAQQVLNDAIHLSPIERAELVEKILSSFNFNARDVIDASWALEAEERINAYDNGQIELNSVDEVFTRINK